MVAKQKPTDRRRLASAREARLRGFEELARQEQRAAWLRWKALCKDRVFALDTARLKYNLTLWYKREPNLVTSFFQPSWPIYPAKIRAAQRRVDKIRDRSFRTVMQYYLSYAIRFGIYMTFKPKRSHGRDRLCPFQVRTFPTGGAKFHIRVVNQHIRPIRPSVAGDETFDDLAISSVSLPDAAEELLKTTPDSYSRGTFVQIDDSKSGSLLSEFVQFCYSPEKLTFVHLNSDRPYLLCIIGENVPVDDVWHPAGSVVKQLREQLYRRRMAGRPMNIAALKKGMNILLRGSPSLSLKEHPGNISPKSLSAIKKRLEL